MLAQLIGPVTGLLDKFIEDKDKKNAIAHKIATMAQEHAQELSKAQIEVNKKEAEHKSLFVAGWRPAVGWVCRSRLDHLRIVFIRILIPIVVVVCPLSG